MATLQLNQQGDRHFDEGGGVFTGNSSINGGWSKYANNPVLGGENLGVIFDISVLKEGNEYWMYVSWRLNGTIALSKSSDGISWSNPVVVLSPAGNWEGELNRPSVLKKDGKYHLWYTGQSDGKSYIGYATSTNGINWTKHPANPVFKNNPDSTWEHHKVTACQVIKKDGLYIMFYIGFENVNLARIGIARSKDGISNWERLSCNPIISPDIGKWDAEACYKPFAIWEPNNNHWKLWYNGRTSNVERIGLVYHDGENLGFKTNILNNNKQNNGKPFSLTQRRHQR